MEAAYLSRRGAVREHRLGTSPLPAIDNRADSTAELHQSRLVSGPTDENEYARLDW